jgi:hypothetical protein
VRASHGGRLRRAAGWAAGTTKRWHAGQAMQDVQAEGRAPSRRSASWSAIIPRPTPFMNSSALLGPAPPIWLNSRNS